MDDDSKNHYLTLPVKMPVSALVLCLRDGSCLHWFCVSEMDPAYIATSHVNQEAVLQIIFQTDKYLPQCPGGSDYKAPKDCAKRTKSCFSEKSVFLFVSAFKFVKTNHVKRAKRRPYIIMHVLQDHSFGRQTDHAAVAVQHP